MKQCHDIWNLKWGISPENMDLEFDSEIRPVIGNGFDYATSINRPSINGVELLGNKSNEELDIKAIQNSEIEALLKKFV